MSRRDANYVDAHVGSRVRLRRQMIGMSQEKLGHILGITFQQVQKYEKGSNRVSASRLFNMSKALGVSIQFFFDELPDGGEGGGFAEESSEPSLMQLAASPDGMLLLKAFSEAGSAAKRKLIASVAKSIADSNE
jgi:transcriptional regulator with XRE-family HTH domain